MPGPDLGDAPLPIKANSPATGTPEIESVSAFVAGEQAQTEKSTNLLKQQAISNAKHHDKLRAQLAAINEELAEGDVGFFRKANLRSNAESLERQLQTSAGALSSSANALVQSEFTPQTIADLIRQGDPASVAAGQGTPTAASIEETGDAQTSVLQTREETLRPGLVQTTKQLTRAEQTATHEGDFLGRLATLTHLYGDPDEAKSHLLAESQIPQEQLKIDRMIAQAKQQLASGELTPQQKAELEVEVARLKHEANILSDFDARRAGIAKDSVPATPGGMMILARNDATTAQIDQGYRNTARQLAAGQLSRLSLIALADTFGESSPGVPNIPIADGLDGFTTLQASLTSTDTSPEQVGKIVVGEYMKQYGVETLSMWMDEVVLSTMVGTSAGGPMSSASDAKSGTKFWRQSSLSDTEPITNEELLLDLVWGSDGPPGVINTGHFVNITEAQMSDLFGEQWDEAAKRGWMRDGKVLSVFGQAVERYGEGGQPPRINMRAELQTNPSAARFHSFMAGRAAQMIRTTNIEIDDDHLSDTTPAAPGRFE